MSTSGRIIGGKPGASRAFLLAALAALAGLGAGTVSCENSDPTAPEGSTITVSANPQTVLPGVAAEVTATVRSKNGTRLPDQEVLFNTTTGTLIPPAQTQLTTDDDGQVTSDIVTTQTATVTASSGTISSSTTVNVINCNLQAITIDADEQDLQDCVTQVTLTVEVVDTGGQGCSGVAVKVSTDPPSTGTNELTGTISPSQGVTNAAGRFTAVFTPSQNQCQTNCSLVANPSAPNGGNCEANFVAEDFSGSVTSTPVTVRESIP